MKMIILFMSRILLFVLCCLKYLWDLFAILEKIKCNCCLNEAVRMSQKREQTEMVIAKELYRGLICSLRWKQLFIYYILRANELSDPNVLYIHI